MAFITPCPVFTVGKLHLVAVAVQGAPPPNPSSTLACTNPNTRMPADLSHHIPRRPKHERPLLSHSTRRSRPLRFSYFYFSLLPSHALTPTPAGVNLETALALANTLALALVLVLTLALASDSLSPPPPVLFLCVCVLSPQASYACHHFTSRVLELSGMWPLFSFLSFFLISNSQHGVTSNAILPLPPQEQEIFEAHYTQREIRAQLAGGSIVL